LAESEPITLAMKFERFRFSASAILSILAMRLSGRLIEICVMPSARADWRGLRDFLAIEGFNVEFFPPKSISIKVHA